MAVIVGSPILIISTLLGSTSIDFLADDITIEVVRSITIEEDIRCMTTEDNKIRS